MEPRDILTPAATVVGLVITAIGLSASITGLSTVLQAISPALVFVVVLFVGASSLTCLASICNSHRCFRMAIVLYTAGWIFMGTVVCLILLGYAWGIQILQLRIPQFPIEIQTLLSATAAIASLGGLVETYRKAWLDRKMIVQLLNQLAEDRTKISEIAQRALTAERNDPKMALVSIAIDLEKRLRRIAISQGFDEQRATVTPVSQVLNYLLSRNVIGQSTANAITLIWKTRNLIVHSGGDVSEKDALIALDLAASVLKKLS